MTIIIRVLLTIFLINIVSFSFSQNENHFFCVVKNETDSVKPCPFRKNKGFIAKQLNNSDTIIIYYDNMPDGYVNNNCDSAGYYDQCIVPPRTSIGEKYSSSNFSFNVLVIIISHFENYYVFKREANYYILIQICDWEEQPSIPRIYPPLDAKYKHLKNYNKTKLK